MSESQIWFDGWCYGFANGVSITIIIYAAARFIRWWRNDVRQSCLPD